MLNEEWIVKLFRLEENDRVTLGDPWQKIVAPGGQVYLAVANGMAVGCAALVHLNNGVFELAKMAVAPETRGQGCWAQVAFVRSAAGSAPQRTHRRAG